MVCATVDPSPSPLPVDHRRHRRGEPRRRSDPRSKGDDARTTVTAAAATTNTTASHAYLYAWRRSQGRRRRRVKMFSRRPDGPAATSLLCPSTLAAATTLCIVCCRPTENRARSRPPRRADSRHEPVLFTRSRRARVCVRARARAPCKLRVPRRTHAHDSWRLATPTKNRFVEKTVRRRSNAVHRLPRVSKERGGGESKTKLKKNNK